MMEPPEDSAGGNVAGRRLSRARKVDTERLWRDGLEQDRHEGIERRRDTFSGRAKVRVDKLPDVAGVGRIALVVSVNRRTAEVEALDDGQLLSVAYSPRLELSNESLVAVGDRVVIHPMAGSGWLLTSIEPRRTRLSRPGPDARDHLDIVVAANLDVLVIVVAAIKPVFHPRFVDRFLVTAQLGGVETIIFLNKCDLLPEEDLPDLSMYSRLGVPVLRGSAENGEGIAELSKRLEGRWSALAGNSGVGKSSIVNALIPGANLGTGEVRHKDGRGRHTTTRASILRMDGGGRLIDTPGIRELALHRLKPSEVGLYFAEFEPFFGTCRFRNCLHVSEPGCAVQGAVETGSIHPDRYASYLRILESLERT